MTPPLGEPGQGPDPVVGGHAQVEQDHVGVDGVDHLERTPPVVGLPDHLDLADRQQRADAFADQGLIVDDHHPHRRGGRTGNSCSVRASGTHGTGTVARTEKPSVPSSTT